MVKIFNEKARRWVEDNKFVEKPPEASNKKYHPDEDAWRWESGHPNAGQYAPDPRPDIPDFSFPVEDGRHFDKDNGQIVSKNKVEDFERKIRQENPDLADKTVQNRVAKRFEHLWKNPRTGETTRVSKAKNRNRNIERAEMIKGYLKLINKNNPDVTYQDLQQRLKGLSTVEIRGKFEGIDEETGIVNYGPPSDRARDRMMEINREFGVAPGSLTQYIITP